MATTHVVPVAQSALVAQRTMADAGTLSANVQAIGAMHNAQTVAATAPDDVTGTRIQVP